ncbi:unnamed protein product [Pleuronectes platessa]|uniref:Uncharacterized protein n=1 Tax=Pleuronectes platessa TaxID=8262 RepID=A0A9N7UV01_PLEPL|nr:unnamed protein product [Pleuronectes platessa]
MLIQEHDTAHVLYQNIFIDEVGFNLVKRRGLLTLPVSSSSWMACDDLLAMEEACGDSEDAGVRQSGSFYDPVQPPPRLPSFKFNGRLEKEHFAGGLLSQALYIPPMSHSLSPPQPPPHCAAIRIVNHEPLVSRCSQIPAIFLDGR